MQGSAPTVEHVFHALSHPTRRAVVDRLSRGPAAVTDLAAPFDMALPSFMQHLKVLERGGLVTSTKQGRVRTYRIDPLPLQAAEGWLATRRALWEQRLDQLDAYLMDLEEDP